MSRRQSPKEVEQLALRRSINGTAIISTIKNLLAEAQALKASLNKVVNTVRAPTAVRDARVKASQTLRIIDLQLNANFRLLLKIMPDLKTIELPAPNEDGTDWLTQMAGILKERADQAEYGGSQEKAQH